jgi:hypothetical protein
MLVEAKGVDPTIKLNFSLIKIVFRFTKGTYVIYSYIIKKNLVIFFQSYVIDHLH